ncbi:hypothetical protein HDIA_4260 [Hartmannibacter diazotrophicus]|uniref:Uncharacterized protein n=1 Tax=Hartmannibacter diazotrophicus TaxID=1482074 RepID=A0A2C9DDH2_9HYPH|nr:hypothetical protein [Hartmannibacter diazotrophicus]SON57801.1 hypothetical protein HDIA_4260 [Hartmannibacter diazotrophicus]
MYEAWLATFGSEMNLGTNTAQVEAGNGIGNHIGGDVAAVATQHVGDMGYGLEMYDMFGGPLVGDIEINVGVNNAIVVAGNGAFNSIDGDVMAIADQAIGDSDLSLAL